MSLLEKVPTMPFAGALDGTEAVSVIGPAGLPVQTTTQGIVNLLASTLWTVSVSAGSEAADKIPLTVQVKDLNGNNLAGARDLFISTLYAGSATITYTDDGPGSIVQQNFGPSRELIFQTDSTGAAAFSVGTTATGQAAVAFITPKGPVVQLITFA